MKYFQDKYPSHSSSKQLPDNFIQEATPLSSSGTENDLELKLTEPKIDFPHLDQQEKESTALTDQDFFGSSATQPKDGFALETSQLLLSGIETCSGVDQSDSQECSLGNDPRVTLPSLKRPEKKRNALNDKGTIFKFFKSSNPSCSSSQVEDKVDTAKECSRNDVESGAWNYKIDEIDPSVVEELPPEIQNEIRGWLRPQKRPVTVKRGSTISHYFSRAKGK